MGLRRGMIFRPARPTAVVLNGILAAFAFLGAARAANLTVEVHGVKPAEGAVRVALYAEPNGFRHEEHARSVLSVPASTPDVTVTFQDLLPGRYALIAYHDENDDKKLDLRFGMFPREGWGLSNDPEIIGPPRFEPSAFDIGSVNTTVALSLHY